MEAISSLYPERSSQPKASRLAGGKWLVMYISLQYQCDCQRSWTCYADFSRLKGGLGGLARVSGMVPSSLRTWTFPGGRLIGLTQGYAVEWCREGEYHRSACFCLPHLFRCDGVHLFPDGCNYRCNIYLANMTRGIKAVFADVGGQGWGVGVKLGWFLPLRWLEQFAEEEEEY